MFDDSRETLLRTLTESTYGPRSEAGMDPDRAREQFQQAMRTMEDRSKIAGLLLTSLAHNVRAAATRPYSGAGTLPEMERVKNVAEKITGTMGDITRQVDLLRHAGLAECDDHDDAGPRTAAMLATDYALAESMDEEALRFLMEAVGNSFAEHVATWLSASAPKLIAQSVADAFQTTSWIQKNVEKYAPLRVLPWESLATRAIRSDDGRALPRYVADLFMREVQKVTLAAKEKEPPRTPAPNVAASGTMPSEALAEGVLHVYTCSGCGAGYDGYETLQKATSMRAGTLFTTLRCPKCGGDVYYTRSTRTESCPVVEPLHEHDAGILEIAQARFDIGTLEPQEDASLNFYRVGAGGLADALADAYDLGLGHGYKAGLPDSMKREDPVLAQIASHAGVATLERRGGDRDFYEMAVWTLERALEDARGAGAAARREAAAGTR